MLFSLSQIRRSSGFLAVQVPREIKKGAPFDAPHSQDLVKTRSTESLINIP